MRHIGELESPREAELFLSYLLVQGIDGHGDEVGGKYDIWIKDEDQFGPAIKLLDEFKKHPADPKYAQSLSQAKQILAEQEQRKREIQKRIIKPGVAGSLGPRTYLTPLLIVVSVVVALMTNFGSSITGPVHRSLQYTCIGPLSESEIVTMQRTLDVNSLNARTLSLQRGEVWRLITPIFVHYGPMHIVFNMIWLAILGTAIEKRYGLLPFGAIVLASAVLPNLVQCVVPNWMGGSPPYLVDDFLMTTLGGMSGVVYGLFGFVWIKSVFDRQSGFRISDINVAIMLIWLVLCIVAPFLVELDFTLLPSNVANWAHGIGLLVGCGIAFLTLPR